MRFDGKTALVTGGGTGIGAATARLLAGEGARVFLVARRPEPLEDTAKMIRDTGGTAEVRTTDVTDDDAVRAAVAEAVRRFDTLDVVVNNAGASPAWTPVHETPDESWEATLAVNLTGPFRVVRAALPHLVEGGGAIVNVSSTSALKASNSVASYSAAKAGLLALSRCVAAEYGHEGVRCNCVVPSWVETPMTGEFLGDADTREDVAGRHALGRVATPEEVARAIAYLASDDAAFVTGTAHPVDGGMMAL